MIARHTPDPLTHRVLHLSLAAITPVVGVAPNRRKPLLLVDDHDGRFVAELQTEDQVRRVLEAMASDDVKVPGWSAAPMDA